jgi:hypothetical protein
MVEIFVPEHLRDNRKKMKNNLCNKDINIYEKCEKFYKKIN